MKLYPQMMTGPEPLGSTGSTRSTLAASSKRSQTVSRRSVDDPPLDEGTLLRILFDESDQVEGPPPTPFNSRPNRRRPTHHSAYWPTTTEAMDRLRQILCSGHEHIDCVWTGMTIRDPGEIGLIIGLDSGGASHLWNTVPITPSARLHQGDRLVADSLLERSRDRILAWWRLAYQEAPFRDRFFAEVRGYAFPTDQQALQTDPDWERAFEVMVGWNRSCRVVHGDEQPGWNPYGERRPIEPLSRRQLARWPWRYGYRHKISLLFNSRRSGIVGRCERNDPPRGLARFAEMSAS
ncbi:MAG: hypothetical protein JNK37_05150 [Verrucomicrobiales bacterium]|nr:hypothetical protein [Verrucomicrobiales bacterium]